MSKQRRHVMAKEQLDLELAAYLGRRRAEITDRAGEAARAAGEAVKLEREQAAAIDAANTEGKLIAYYSKEAAKGARKRAGYAEKKLPNMDYVFGPGEVDVSPEGIAWLNRGNADKGLMRLISQTRLSDNDKMGVYNALRSLRNNSPMYFRDTVFSISWDRHQKNNGRRSIVHEIRYTLWRIRLLKAHGWSTQFILDSLQGITETNKTLGQFSSASIEELIANHELGVEHDETYGAQQSDYTAPIGEKYDSGHKAPKAMLMLNLNEAELQDIKAYLMGMKVMVLAKLKDKVATRSLWDFVRLPGSVKERDAWIVYTGQLFRAYLIHALGKENAGYYLRSSKEQGMRRVDKEKFLVYVFYILGGRFDPQVKPVERINSIRIASGSERGGWKPRPRAELIRKPRQEGPKDAWSRAAETWAAYKWGIGSIGGAWGAWGAWGAGNAGSAGDSNANNTNTANSNAVNANNSNANDMNTANSNTVAS
jgi:hypothetical protein